MDATLDAASPESTGPRRRRPLRIFALACILAAASACTEVPDADEQVDRVDPTDGTEPIDPVDVVDPTEPTEPIVDPGPTPVAPIVDPSVAVCLPGAAAYPESEIPEAPLHLLPQLCSDEAIESAPIPEGTQQWTRYSWDPAERILTVESDDNNFQRETTFWLDADHTVRQIVATGNGGFYVVEEGTTTYRFDEAGHLVYKRATRIDPFSDETLADLEKTQKWDGDRIVARTERDLLGDFVLADIHWTYDDAGRLVEARAESRAADGTDPMVETALWTYDDAGRPTALVRTRRDVEILSESWTWDDDGNLLQRAHESVGVSVLAAEHGLTEGDWNGRRDLDDMEPVQSDYSRPDPWQQASLGFVDWERPFTSVTSTETAEGCRNLARGAGHGYPVADGLYDLGVAAEHRPTGTGFAHGYDGYGWYYGDSAWFGHFGVGTMWPGAEAFRDATFQSEFVYDDGFMIAETIDLTWLDGRTEHIERIRERADDAVVDTVLLGADTHQAARRTLEFDLGETGHVVARRQLENGVLLGQASWTRDADGRPLTYHFEQDSLGTAGTSESVLASFAAMPSGSWDTLHLTWNDAGRLVERWVSGGMADLEETPRETRRYDDAGRLVEVRHGLGHDGGDKTFEFRADGQPSRVCDGWNGDLWCTVHAYDALGREIERRQEHDGESWVQAAMVYSCAE